MRRIFVLATAVLSGYAIDCNAQLLTDYGVKAAHTSALQTNIRGPISGPNPNAGPGWLWTINSVSSVPGLNVAAFAEWFKFPSLSIITQLEYDQRGARYQYVNPNVVGYSSTEGSLDYLSLPIMGKFKPISGLLQPYLIAGPRIDYLVSYRDLQIEPESPAVYANFKRWMLGWSTGAGVQAKSILPVDISAEIRHDTDFANSYDDGVMRISNKALHIWLGVSL